MFSKMASESRLITCLAVILSMCCCVHSADDNCRDGVREAKAGLCGPWKEVGFCTSDPVMEVICRKTCGFCVAPTWSDWSNWTECSVSCATGIKTRSRVCISPNPNTVSSCRRLDGSVSPYESATVTCNTKKCPECQDLELEAGCKTWALIGFCQFHANEMKKWCAKSCKFCSEQLKGIWDEWSTWSKCPVQCGGGIRSRSRVCISPDIGEVAVCRTTSGIEATFDVVKEKCNTHECEGCKKKDRNKDQMMCSMWKQAGYCEVKKKEMDYWCEKTCSCDQNSSVSVQ